MEESWKWANVDSIRKETGKRAQCREDQGESGKWLNVRKIREGTGKGDKCREDPGIIREMA